MGLDYALYTHAGVDAHRALCFKGDFAFVG